MRRPRCHRAQETQEMNLAIQVVDARLDMFSDVAAVCMTAVVVDYVVYFIWLALVFGCNEVGRCAREHVVCHRMMQSR